MKVKEFETGKSHVMKAVNALIQSGYSALEVENIMDSEETVTPEEVITEAEEQE